MSRVDVLSCSCRIRDVLHEAHSRCPGRSRIQVGELFWECTFRRHGSVLATRTFPAMNLGLGVKARSFVNGKPVWAGVEFDAVDVSAVEIVQAGLHQGGGDPSSPIKEMAASRR